MPIFRNRENPDSVMKGVFIAYFILLFHVALLGLVGIVVLFFTGILNYLPWILLGGAVMIVGCGYMVMRYLRKKSRSMVQVLGMPEFRGKNIEVNLMGGLASFKIQDTNSESSADSRYLESDGPSRLLTHADGEKRQKLESLAEMRDNRIITPEEFERAKQRLLDQ